MGGGVFVGADRCSVSEGEVGRKSKVSVEMLEMLMDNNHFWKYLQVYNPRYFFFLFN